MEYNKGTDWDVFISHASEDKESIARPLAKALMNNGIKVWFDDHTLKLGDSLRQKIDEGLAHSRYGIIILSPDFFSKEWPNKELDALVSRDSSNQKVILPIWHNVSFDDVKNYSPILSGKLAVSTNQGIEQITKKILETMIIKKSHVNEMENTKIQFSDDFNIDPISVKFAVIDFFNSDSILFQVEWPEIHLDLLKNAKILYEEARNYREKSSPFYGRPPNEVSQFIDYCGFAFKNAEHIQKTVEKRIPLLIEGIRKRYNFVDRQIQVPLTNLIMISNYEIQNSLAFALSYEPLRNKYFPSIWHNLCRGSSEKIIKPMLNKLFNIQDTLCYVNVNRVANLNINYDYFWIPKSMIIEIYRKKDFRINEWYSSFLIPQIELYLAKKELDQIVYYDHFANIYKVVDENRKDIDISDILMEEMLQKNGLK